MNTPVVQATVPGVEGNFGVRVGHMPLISSLRPGVVTVQSEEAATPTRFFIAGGFANVNGTECSVMAETAVDVLTLKPDIIQSEIVTLQTRLVGPIDDVTAAELRAELDIAKARLQVAYSV